VVRRRARFVPLPANTKPTGDAEEDW
jgi:hypothetical protein